jgi:hypothetical protein
LSPPIPPLAFADDDALPEPDVAVLLALAPPPLGTTAKFKPPLMSPPVPPVAFADEYTAPEPRDIAVLLALASPPAAPGAIPSPPAPPVAEAETVT